MLESGGRTPRPRRNSNRAPAAPTPAELVAAAQVQATATGVPCQVTEATLLGQVAEGQLAYEAACADGPGYILIGSTPPQATNCIELVSSARQARERDPAAVVGTECKIARNADILPYITAYAQSASVACTVDDGLAIGKGTNGSLVFEVGCAGKDGYRLEQNGGSWTAIECLQVITSNGTCRFTTPQEQAATVKEWLAGTDAASCDVQQARFMGRNPNGVFYEAKCASGDGYVARLDNAKAVQQVYPCAAAAQIGGGCTLTTVAAAPVTTESAPVPATE